MNGDDRILIERLLVKQDDMKEDLLEIKQRLPENLIKRLEQVEQDNATNTRWRVAVVAISTFFAGLITYGEKVIAAFKVFH